MRHIDLFVDSDAPIGAVAAAVAREGDMEIGPLGADGSITLVGEEAVATLSEHDFPDGVELRLSGYRYVVSVTVDAAGHLGDVAEALALRRLAVGLGRDHGVLLVLDLPRPGPARRADPSVGGARSWGG
jgi:hypothetical protein